MQGCTPVNAHGVSCFLQFLLAGFLFISSITLIIAILLLTSSGGVSLILRSLAGAACSATSALPASAIMTFLLITLLILSFLLLCKQLNLPAILEVMAFGAVDLAVLLVGAS